MDQILAHIQNGHLVSLAPVDLPEGTTLKVNVEPAEIVETPEEIARWLAEFDAIPPLEFTEAEEAAWKAALGRKTTCAKVKQ